MRHGAYLEVQCPRCEASVGKPCTNMNTGEPFVSFYHAARKMAAKKKAYSFPSLEVTTLEQDLLKALSGFIDRRIAAVLSVQKENR